MSKFKFFIKEKNIYLSVSKIYLDAYVKISKIECEGRVFIINGNEHLYQLYVNKGDNKFIEMDF